MPHPISELGFLHTAVSIAAALAGFYNLFRYRRFTVSEHSGKVYLALLVASVLSSFGLSSTGGFNIGHALGILALLAIGGAMLAPKIGGLGRATKYISMFLFNLTFFLLFVPGINETLTRLPVSSPLAAGPESPLVRGVLAGWLVVFLVGTALQGLWLYFKTRRSAIA
ncbi:hypothetical protein [Pseudomonas sp.]|uniref:hypothetical protein n=1 Tax=Pseudomonas sp. TaxID=306 RepID=UPI003C75FD51